MEQLGNFALNHWELVLALIIILGLLLGGPWLNGARGYLNITPTSATTLINHEDALVIDVREDQEFRDGHIINALHIPTGEVPIRLKELEKYRQRPIILVCRSGNRSGRSAAFLHQQGFTLLYNLEGGIIAWQNANLPVVRK